MRSSEVEKAGRFGKFLILLNKTGKEIQNFNWYNYCEIKLIKNWELCQNIIN